MMRAFARATAFPLALLLVCGAPFSARAQTAQEALPEARVPPRLPAATARLLADEQLTHGTVGIVVLDAGTGEVIESVNPDRSLVPASLLKVATTATALAELGPETRFETRLGYTGTLDGEVLRGDLVIVGGGDPSLGAGRPAGALDLERLLERWATAVRAAGIRRVEGSVVGDDHLDPGAEPSPYWQWNDIANYYGAGAGALMIHENLYALQLQRTPGEGDRPNIIGMVPDPGEIHWDNRLRSGPPRSGDQSYIFGAPGTVDRVIRGTIPAGRGMFEVKASLPDPALQVAGWLTAELQRAGVTVAGAPRQSGRAVPLVATLDTVLSPSLLSLVALTNFRSVNLYAEAFYDALARHWQIDDNPAEIGERLVESWRLRGLDTDGWEQVDGSGLGMRNLITPRQLAAVLRAGTAIGLRETLPRVGVEGTVQSVLRGRPAAVRLRAKSGTLKRARGFCGYATAADGRELVFVVVANNFADPGSGLRRDMAAWMAALVE